MKLHCLSQHCCKPFTPCAASNRLARQMILPDRGFVVISQLRHMRSLRVMERDHGWIHTLLEEAENERMVGINPVTCVRALQRCQCCK